MHNTEAHCFDNSGPSSIIIGNDEVNVGQRIPVKKTVQHPQYNKNTDAYDLGLVFLSQSTTLDIPLIRLNDDDSYPDPGTTTFTMGWGDTDPGETQRLSNDLLVVDVEVISNEDCKGMKKSGENYGKKLDLYMSLHYIMPSLFLSSTFTYNFLGNWIFDDMMCAYTENQDACQGDSGKILCALILPSSLPSSLLQATDKLNT